MKTTAWYVAAFVLAALCVAGCVEDGEKTAARGTDIAVLGPTPQPETPAAKMTVRRGFATIGNNTAYDLGARGWSAPGPLVDFQIHNDGRTNMVLGANPAAVVVSGAYNAADFTVTQPATTIPPGGSTSFSLVFTVEEKGDFEFAVSISNHGAFNADFFFVVSGKGQEQLGYTKAIAAPTTYGVFINGAAESNPEQRHEALDGAKGTAFSPNGRFGACQHNGLAKIFSTSTGNAVSVIETAFNQFTGTQFSWQNGPGGLQYLALLDKDPDGYARRLYTCVVSGNHSPQVTSLREVRLFTPVIYDRWLASVTWSSDGSRLAFHETRIPYEPSNTGHIYGCLFNGGEPGQARVLANVHPHPSYNKVSWANATSVGDALVYQITNDNTIDFVPVTVADGMPLAGAPMRISDYAARWTVSPNGNRLALVQGVPGQIDTYPHVYCFSTPATPPVLALNFTAPGTFNRLTYGSPAWTPDSRGIVFQGTYADGSIDMFSQKFTQATGPAVLLGAGVNLAAGLDGLAIAEFAISPEGQRVVFQTSDYGYPQVTQRVYLASLEATPVVSVIYERVTPNSNHYFFWDLAFSPRGDFVSFLARAPQNYPNYHLMAVPLTGARFLVARDAYDATGELIGFGIEKYHWLR